MASPAPTDHRWMCPLTRFVIRSGFERPDPDDVRALADRDITVLAGLVGRMYTLSAQIRSLYQPSLPLVGVATTVKCPPGDNLGVMEALDHVQPGDVLVIDAQGFTEWCLGGYEMLRIAREKRGLVGVVVNGAFRDVLELKAAGIPIYGLGISPFSGPKIGPGEVNVAVCCGGVIVHPGDVVAASEEGVIVVPRNVLPAVAAAMRARDAKRQGLSAAALKARHEAGLDAFYGAMREHIDGYFELGRGERSER